LITELEEDTPMPFPPPHTKLTIFDTEPAPNADTYAQGLPATTTQYTGASVILFSPDLQIVASFDNTGSDVTSTFETSVSKGFTFGMTQGLSITAAVEVSIEVVKASVSTTFSMSFSEEWNTTTTKTITFSCPPKTKAFVYQGTLMSKILVFDAGTGKYSWSGAAGRALTEVLASRNQPYTQPSLKLTAKP
jgi:hypothetical protein